MRLFRFSLVLFALLSAVGVSAQQGSLCGNIKSGELTVPAYKFIVVDKNGKQIENLHVEAVVMVREYKWGHNFGDWNWETVHHNVPIPVTFDPKEGVFVSKELSQVRVALRKGPRQTKCLDQVRGYYFQFTFGGEMTPTNGYQGVFGSQNFENKRFDEIILPEASKPIKITLKNWDGTKIL